MVKEDLRCLCGCKENFCIPPVPPLFFWTWKTGNQKRGKKKLSIIIVFCFFFFFLGPYPQHMEVPRLGVESEMQLPAYTTAIATQDPSCICDLHHSSRQHWILNPLSKARDRTPVLMDVSQVRYLLSHEGNSHHILKDREEHMFSSGVGLRMVMLNRLLYDH